MSSSFGLSENCSGAGATIGFLEPCLTFTVGGGGTFICGDFGIIGDGIACAKAVVPVEAMIEAAQTMATRRLHVSAMRDCRDMNWFIVLYRVMEKHWRVAAEKD